MFLRPIINDAIFFYSYLVVIADHIAVGIGLWITQDL